MGRGGFPGGNFGGINMNQLMKQAKKMQADIEESQKEIQAKEFEATTGGGAVYVKANGAKQILEIKIDKDVVDPDDVEMLQDLIMTAINEVMKQVDDATNSEMGKYNIPGMGF